MNVKLTLWIIVSINFFLLFNQFLLITAFPTIMEEFQVNEAEVQWLTTAFLLTTAVMIPINGYLVDRFTLRSLAFVALGCFLTGTIFGIFASSFPALVLARIIQALGAGIMLPLAQTVLLLVYPSDQRGRAMGILGLVMNVAPAVGPSIAGLIVDVFHWKYLFWLTLLPILLLFVLTHNYVQNITPSRSAQFDMFSFFLSGLGFIALLLGVSAISTYSILDARVILAFVVSIAAFTWFSYRQTLLHIPLLDIRVFSYPVFFLSTLSVLLVSLLLLSMETLIPLFAQDVQGSSAFVSGMILMPGTIILAVFSWISGIVFDRYGGRTIISVGFVLLVVSLGIFCLFQPETPSIIVIFAFSIFMMGVSITMMPQVASAMNALPASIMPHGTAVINALRQFAMAVGVTSLTTVVTLSANSQNNIYNGINAAFLTMTVLGVFAAIIFVASSVYAKKLE